MFDTFLRFLFTYLFYFLPLVLLNRIKFQQNLPKLLLLVLQNAKKVKGFLF